MARNASRAGYVQSKSTPECRTSPSMANGTPTLMTASSRLRRALNSARSPTNSGTSVARESVASSGMPPSEKAWR
jgi:hypothetical protein